MMTPIAIFRSKVYCSAWMKLTACVSHIEYFEITETFLAQKPEESLVNHNYTILPNSCAKIFGHKRSYVSSLLLIDNSISLMIIHIRSICK